MKAAFKKAEKYGNKEPHKPTVIIADTIKGYGVSFMENDILWHYRFPHDGWDTVAKIEELGTNWTYTETWNPTYPEQMKRVYAEPRTHEAIHSVVREQE